MGLATRWLAAPIAALGFGCASGPATPGSDAAPPGAPDDAFLANLVGRWDISRRIRGSVVHNRLEARWVLRHRFVELHMIDVADPPKYEAIVLMGYDAAGERYVAHWTDTYGAQYSGVGYGKRVGEAVDFVFSAPDGAFHNTFTWNPAQGTWRSLMEAEGKGGRRSFFAEDTLSPAP